MYKDLYTDAYHILYEELPAGQAQNKKVMETRRPDRAGECIGDGSYIPTFHFRSELEKEGLTIVDAQIVIRRGHIVEEPEVDICTGQFGRQETPGTHTRRTAHDTGKHKTRRMLFTTQKPATPNPPLTPPTKALYNQYLEDRVSCP